MYKILVIAGSLMVAASAQAGILICKGGDVHLHATLDRDSKVVVHRKGQACEKYAGQGYEKREKAKVTYLFNFGEGQKLRAEVTDFPQTGSNGVWSGSDKGAVSLRCRVKY